MQSYTKRHETLYKFIRIIFMNTSKQHRIFAARILIINKFYLINYESF